jgi:hypothetical protein
MDSNVRMRLKHIEAKLKMVERSDLPGWQKRSETNRILAQKKLIDKGRIWK